MMRNLLKNLEPYRWPLAVVVAVAIAAWAALEIVVIALELDPSTVDALVAVRSWAGRIAAGAGAFLVPIMVSMLDRNRDGRIDARDFDDPPSGGGAGAAGAALLALVIAAGAVPLTACGGPPREAREATEALADAVDRADVLVAARLERRGAEVRADMLSEVARGAITSVEQGLAYLDEHLAPERTAVQALRVAKAALLTAEGALDAWDSSAAGDGLLVPAACVVAALDDVADALDALGVEVPDAITSGATTIARFAGPLCPAPALAAVPS